MEFCRNMENQEALLKVSLELLKDYIPEDIVHRWSTTPTTLAWYVPHSQDYLNFYYNSKTKQNTLQELNTS